MSVSVSWHSTRHGRLKVTLVSSRWSPKADVLLRTDIKIQQWVRGVTCLGAELVDQVVRSGVQLSSWHGAAVFTRCHSACCWSNIMSRRQPRSASSSALVVPATRRSSLGDRGLRLLDHAHGTVYLSSSPTARHLWPSRNTSRLIYLLYLFRIDCVRRPCSSLGRLRRYNFVILHQIHYNHRWSQVGGPLAGISDEYFQLLGVNLTSSRINLQRTQ